MSTSQHLDRAGATAPAPRVDVISSVPAPTPAGELDARRDRGA